MSHDYFPSHSVFLGWWKISEIGQIGYSTEVELVLREKKAGKLGGKKNW